MKKKLFLKLFIAVCLCAIVALSLSACKEEQIFDNKKPSASTTDNSGTTSGGSGNIYIPDDSDIEKPDFDDDGIPDVIDPDDDNDGIPDAEDPDDDNDGVPDTEDPDDNNDDLPDEDDSNKDGVPDDDEKHTTAQGPLVYY